jgi:transcriptional regulator with XRE-family HTH domain
MELPDRIATIIKVNQHSPASFADVLGVQRSSVSHVLNGRNKPSMDFIQKIIEHFPRVDASWLITGKQAGVSQEPSVKARMESSENFQNILIGDFQEIPSEKIVVFYTDRTFDIYEHKK